MEIIGNPDGELHYVWAFIKFGEREFIEKFHSGDIYMNHVNYLRTWENFKDTGLPKEIHPIFDPRDAQLIENGTGTMEFKLQRKWKPIKVQNLNLWRNYNALCMFGLYDFIPSLPFIDRQNTQFGNCFTIILHPKVFMDRLASKLVPKYGDLRMSKVMYSNTLGNNEDVIKETRFSYQKEYRFMIPENKKKEAECTNIGSIEDITSPIIDIKRAPFAFFDGKTRIEIPDIKK